MDPVSAMAIAGSAFSAIKSGFAAGRGSRNHVKRYHEMDGGHSGY